MKNVNNSKILVHKLAKKYKDEHDREIGGIKVRLNRAERKVGIKL